MISGAIEKGFPEKGRKMSFLKAKSIDATEGKLLPKIILYAIPLILSTLIQQLFNAVDIVVLGQMANDDGVAVASVAATTSVTALLVTSFVGLASGSRVLLARQIGAKDNENVRKTTDTSLLLSLGIGVVIAIVGFLAAPWFLEITNCPEDCIEGALIYIRIYVLAAPLILFYNFGSSAITAAGDTQRPLYYILIGGATNVVLNIILCLILPQKIVAVAVATVVSQVICAILVFSRLLKMDGPCRIVVKKMRFSMRALGGILRYGLPMMLVNALFPLSNLQIASAINSFGTLGTAGNGAASTIENIVSATSGPIATTAATFMGQNIGANKPERVSKSFWQCMLITTVFGGLVGVITFFTGRFWLGTVVGYDNNEAITFGLVRMSCTTLFYFVACINNVFGSSLQAYGYSAVSAVNSIFSVFVFRIIWMQGIYPLCADMSTYERFFMVTFCFLVSWIIRMLVNIVAFTIVSAKYKRGHKRVL